MPDVVPESNGSESAPERRGIVRNALGVGLAVGASGVTFGAAGTAAGLSVLQCCAMSLLVFTGASQFALIGVLGSGGSVIAGTVSAVALGIRNSFYGIRLASLLGLRGGRRIVASQVVTDESTAMATAQFGPAASRLAFAVTGVSLYLTWNVATLIGAVTAGAIGDPNSFGIDAAVPAAFLALVAPRLAGATERRTAVLAVTIALIAVPLTPVGVPVLLAALAVLPVLRRPTTPTARGGRMIWSAVFATAVGCYSLKLAGLLVPARVLRHPTVQRVAEQLPVALLMALVAIGTFADGRTLVIDARVAGLAAAGVALLLRAPFLVVVVAAAVTTALVRLL